MMERKASLEVDPYFPPVTFEDHVFYDDLNLPDDDGCLHFEDLYCSDGDYVKCERFFRIASAQELEEFDTFYDTTEDVTTYDATPETGVGIYANMDPEARAKLEEEWKTELEKTEADIATLREILSHKVKHAQDLKHRLGITVWKEFKDDMEQGLRNIQESTVYQKTSQTIKTAGEKTTVVLTNLGASVSKKLGEVKSSPAFRSIEEKVGTAYSSVKTKVAGSQNSSGNFEETLENMERRSSSNVGSTPSSPVEKPAA